MDEHNMALWGLNERFRALAARQSRPVGRILSQEKGLYRLVWAQGEQSAAVSGKFRYEIQMASDYPAVGDFVLFDANERGELGVIHAVLPRESAFIRKAAGASDGQQVVAANVDTVFLCMSLNRDFNLRRLERYLSIAWNSGATPVIVLTKADLCDDLAGRRRDAESVAAQTTVLLTSVVDQDGYESVLPYLQPGRTVAFLGSSGVGKSTLINRLLGEDRLPTNGLRDDDHGRHTTTRRSLMQTPQGGLVVDTPGMRELGLWDSAAGLDKTFAEIDALAASCRFADCTHTGEPGCAVRAAIEDASLSEARLAAYQKLKAENAYTENSARHLAEKNRKFKEIAKINKAAAKQPR